ncbi:MAG: oligosaccharide flippase family protein, partial [Maribacter arcticus]|uniref:lipopolysaccharide biosynthesis protein n=1 Tax=Maribacter arcticus TaxID=561365 RepID=UPI003000FF6A
MRKLSSFNFLKNASIYTFSDVLNKIVPFLLLPVLTRYLSPTDYGIIAVFTIFTSVLGVFISLETHSALSVYYFKLKRDKLKVYLYNTLLIIFTTTLIVLIVVLIGKNYLEKTLELPLKWLIIGVLVAAFSLFSTINLLLWQNEKKPIPLSSFRIAQTIVNLGVTLLLVVGFGMNWEGRLIGSTVAAILFGFFSFIFFFKRDYLTISYNRKFALDALKFGLPLLPHAISMWIKVGIDRILLTSLVSAAAAGLYTVGYQIGSVLMVLTNAFNKSYTPYVYEKLANNEEDVKLKQVKYAYYYFAFLLLIALLLSTIFPWFFKFFLGKDFGDSIEFIPWFAFSFAFYGMYYIVLNYVMFTKKTLMLSYVTFTIGIIHILLSYWFIKMNGAIGAAQANTVV